MIYVSPTGLQDFIACSYRYKLRMNKDGEEETTNEDLQVGTICHNLLETNWKDTQEQLQASGAFLAKGLSSDARNKLRHSLEMYENFRALLGEDDEKELKFKILLFDDVYMVGKIDRIVNHSEILLDWKTTTSPPKNINSDIQFLSYSYAYSRIKGKLPKGVYYASLSTGELIGLTYFKNISWLFKDVIPSVVKNIRDNNYARTGIFNSKCFKCLYKEQCL